MQVLFFLTLLAVGANAAENDESKYWPQAEQRDMPVIELPVANHPGPGSARRSSSGKFAILEEPTAGERVYGKSGSFRQGGQAATHPQQPAGGRSQQRGRSQQPAGGQGRSQQSAAYQGRPPAAYKPYAQVGTDNQRAYPALLDADKKKAYLAKLDQQEAAFRQKQQSARNVPDQAQGRQQGNN